MDSRAPRFLSVAMVRDELPSRHRALRALCSSWACRRTRCHSVSHSQQEWRALDHEKSCRVKFLQSTEVRNVIKPPAEVWYEVFEERSVNFQRVQLQGLVSAPNAASESVMTRSAHSVKPENDGLEVFEGECARIGTLQHDFDLQPQEQNANARAPNHSFVQCVCLKSLGGRKGRRRKARTKGNTHLSELEGSV